MMKFKKFMAAAMVGTMVLGVTSAAVVATPIASVYAADTLTVEIDKKEVAVGDTITFTVKKETSAVTSTATFEVSPSGALTFSQTSGEEHKAVVNKSAAGKEITVTATANSETGTCKFTVKAAEEPETATYGYDEYNGGAYLDTNGLDGGNYIYVAYYSDTKGEKLKNTFVYTREEMETFGGLLPLDGINLKKGASFKVYSETVSIDKANLVVVDAQSPKIKVKVKDLTKDTLMDALTITIDKTDLKESDLLTYGDKIFINGESIADVVYDKDGKATSATANDELLTTLKLAARGAGATFYAQYLASETTTPSEAKFKISAAAKKPSVKIDYVAGTYDLSKMSYMVVKVDEDGVISSPDGDWTTPDSKTKEIKTIEDLLKLVPDYEKATEFEDGVTYYTEEPQYREVNNITEANFAANKANLYTKDEKGDYAKLQDNAEYSADAKYYRAAGVKYVAATGVTKDNFSSATYYVAVTPDTAAIIARSAAKGAKMESLMAVETVERLKTLKVDNAADGKTATLNLVDGKDDKGEDKLVKVGTVTFTDNGVSIAAEKGSELAYWDTSAKTPKWVVVKEGTSTKKDVALPKDGLQIRVNGVKAKGKEAGKFGSAEATITKPEAAPTAVELIEKVASNFSKFEEGVVYYSDAEAKNKVDTTSAPSGTDYWVKAVYTPVPATVTTPATGTDYYTTADEGKTFTKATLTENKFAAGTTYYTRTEKGE